MVTEVTRSFAPTELPFSGDGHVGVPTIDMFEGYVSVATVSRGEVEHMTVFTPFKASARAGHIQTPTQKLVHHIDRELAFGFFVVLPCIFPRVRPGRPRYRVWCLVECEQLLATGDDEGPFRPQRLNCILTEWLWQVVD